jgi:hypothetical protein
MAEDLWTPDEIVQFEEWYLDDRNTGKEEMLQRLLEVPHASRRAFRDRLLAEIDWRKDAISPQNGRLNADDAKKIRDLDTKARYLAELPD